MFYYIYLSNWLLLLFHFGWLFKITFFNNNFIYNIALKSDIGVKLLSLCWKQCVKLNVFLLKTQLFANLKLINMSLQKIFIIALLHDCISHVTASSCFTSTLQTERHYAWQHDWTKNIVINAKVFLRLRKKARTKYRILCFNPKAGLLHRGLNVQGFFISYVYLLSAYFQKIMFSFFLLMYEDICYEDRCPVFHRGINEDLAVWKVPKYFNI